MSVLGLVRPLLARAARRLPRRRDPVAQPALPDRLEFLIEGEQALVRLRLGRARHAVSRLQVQSREGDLNATYGFATPDGDQLSTARIDLVDLVRRQGFRGTADLYVTWDRAPASEQGLLVRKLGRQRIGGFPETFRPPHAQHLSIDDIDVRLDVTVNGNLSLRIGDDPGTGVRCTTTALHRRGQLTELTCDVKTHNRAIVSASTVVFGRISQTRVHLETTFGLLEERTRDDHGLLHWEVRPQIDLAALAASIPESDELLDVMLEVTVEERSEPYVLTFQLPDGLSRGRLESTIAEYADRTHVFMPYLTYRTRRLAYRVEHFDTADHRFLRRLLWVAWLFPLIKPFTRIWLIGEVPYKAQDNGLHFFRYLRTSHPRRRAYYVIDSSSPDREKLLELGNVIDRSSRRHMLYSLLASRLVGSHHAEYLFASRDRPVVRHTRGVRIFLQHGITAAKNVTAIYARQGTLELPTERFLVASELERRIVIEDYGYRPSQVAVTGFARFDKLFASVEPTGRTVLVMPTWREGLRRNTFEDTEYFRNWHAFLTDPRLKGLLEANDLQIALVLHPNLRVFADFFAIPNVQLIRQDDVDVQSLVSSGAVLVTDFSSVSWDFSFLRRPIIYFQFDQHLLIGPRAPHIDFAKQLPGPVVTTVNRLIDELISVLDRGCTMDDEYWTRARAFLSYRDQRNCERILSVVDHAWRPSTAFERIRNSAAAQRWWSDFRTGPTYYTWMKRLYSLASLLPRTNEVVFECDRGRHFGDSPRYLYERLIARAERPQVVWANNTTLRLTDPRTRKLTRHSPTYYWHLGRAAYWVNNQNFPPALAKPARTAFLQTWHGTPLKRMQHDVENMAGRDAEYQQRAARLTSYWDVLISGSPYATACFRSAFAYRGKILELGYPRNDVFSWPDADERSAHTRQRLGLEDDRRAIILYAPTFRDDNRLDANWRHRLELDIPRMAAEIGTDYVLLVRFHPLVRESIARLLGDHPEFVVDVSSYNDIQELLLVSDVLITDYSSVLFDFAVLLRPILFFTYDLQRYRDVLRGFYLDLESVAPGPLLFDNDAVLSALGNLDEVKDRYAERLREFAATYAPRDDGGASDRVLDAFLGPAVSPAERPSTDCASKCSLVPAKVETEGRGEGR